MPDAGYYAFAGLNSLGNSVAGAIDKRKENEQNDKRYSQILKAYQPDIDMTGMNLHDKEAAIAGIEAKNTIKRYRQAAKSQRIQNRYQRAQTQALQQQGRYAAQMAPLQQANLQADTSLRQAQAGRYRADTEAMQTPQPPWQPQVVDAGHGVKALMTSPRSAAQVSAAPPDPAQARMIEILMRQYGMEQQQAIEMVMTRGQDPLMQLLMGRQNPGNTGQAAPARPAPQF